METSGMMHLNLLHLLRILQAWAILVNRQPSLSPLPQNNPIPVSQHHKMTSREHKLRIKCCLSFTRGRRMALQSMSTPLKQDYGILHIDLLWRSIFYNLPYKVIWHSVLKLRSWRSPWISMLESVNWVKLFWQALQVLITNHLHA